MCRNKNICPAQQIKFASDRKIDNLNKENNAFLLLEATI